MEEFIWITFGILVTLAFVFIYFKYIDGHISISDPVETTGEVMEVEAIESPHTMPMIQGDQHIIRYHPIIRFRVSGTQLVRFRHRKGVKDASSYKIGQQVKVIYSKKNPLMAKIA